MPSIAVVIPCWNAEKWVGKAIASALGQNYPGLEIVAIDDGSTDNSLDVIKSFGAAVRWETGPNRGAGAARNRGLGLIASEYVLFLDADDTIEAPLLHSLARACGASCDLVFGPSVIELPDGRRRDRARFTESETPISIFPRILGENWVPPHSILWRADFVRSIGAWNERMVLNDDGELLARALLARPNIGFAAEGRAVYVQHPNPSRVSLRRTPEAVLCQIEHLAARAREIEATPFAADGRPALAHSAYELARESYSRGLAHLGHRALQLSRSLGFRRHRGSRAHRLAASILGLELKEDLSRLRWRIARGPT